MPPLFLDQTRPEEPKNFFGRHPPPPYLRVWMTGPCPLSQGLDPALSLNPQRLLKWTCNGVFERLFGPGGGNFNTSFPKIIMPRGVVQGDVEASI